MRILSWHVHGAWSTAFVRGAHDHLIPVTPDRGPDGRGRPTTYEWPERAREVTPEELRESPVDVVLLQRPHEIELCERWTGLRPGRDVPAVYVEHNAPQGRIAEMRHPMADRDDLTLVHVTHFNALFWDAGGTPVRVVEHGIPDPGHRYTGEIPHACVVVNEPVRRGRVTGTDLLPRLNGEVHIDLFGIDSEPLGGQGDVPHGRLLTEMARRRVYLHPVRWTSLGLSLLEAMHLGMPVVALATTEVTDAVPEECGVVSNRIDVLRDALSAFARDPDRARRAGDAAREAALARFGLERFLADWDTLLQEVVR
ncbi:MAG TPA: glycosyltransferase [Miltoncostaeaceae bacterium]|nr:glycosyltransferase [Miltoncostaeaceae bacterium]